MENKSKQRGVPGIGTESAPPGDWQLALAYIQEHPLAVLAGIGFLFLCIVAGGLFSLSNIARDREVMTEYAAALASEDSAARVDALTAVAEGDNRWQAEALYLAGEAAITAKDYDRAREVFTSVLENHSESDYAAPAAEGLAFLDENAGDLQKALEGYTAVFQTYDDTFVGRRQPLNMARVQEALGNLAEAITAYEKQLELFPESAIARRASAALARLKSEHPDLFPEEELADVTVDAADDHAGHDHAEQDDLPDDTAAPIAAEPVPTDAAPSPTPGTDAPAPGDPADAIETPAEAAPAAESTPEEVAPAEATETAPADEPAPEEAAPADATETVPEEAAPEAAETTATPNNG